MDLDLDEIRRATEAATEGPWGTNPDDDGYAVHDVRCPSDAMRAQVYGEPHRAAADATFIAGARSWVPTLVAEVERLRAALGSLLEHHDATCTRTTHPWAVIEAGRLLGRAAPSQQRVGDQGQEGADEQALRNPEGTP